MKILQITLIAMSCALISRAQAPQGFNYQAVARDVAGDIIIDSTIGVQFQIREASAVGTVIYTETHNPTTNSFGLFTSIIGQGTSTDNFSTIDWANNTFFLETSIDVNGTSSYVSMGTSQMMSVPYSLNALTANNVTGLEQINEGGNVGWRLVGRNPAYYGTIGIGAIDLGTSFSPSNGATGNYSFVAGYNSLASGAFGTSIGRNTEATGFASVAMGNFSSASGDHAMSFGQDLSNESYNSFAFGRNNVGGGFTLQWIDTDPLFEIGNGLDSNNRNNALTVLKNGLIGIANSAPTADLHIKQSTSTESGPGGIRLEFSNTTNEWKVYHSGSHLSFAENGTRNAYIQAGTGNFITLSDRNYKNNIKKMEPALDRILKLSPSTYKYNWQQNPTSSVIGLIAQEVQPLFPEIVATSEEGTLGISYSNLSVITVKAIQEQQEIIETQNKTIEALLKRIEILEKKIN